MKYIAIILILFSCSTPEKLVNKALSKDRAKVAEITRAEFPCVDLKVDTVTVTDSLYEFVECPEETSDYAPARIDTLTVNGETVYRTRTVKVPVLVTGKTHYITKTVEDSAKIYLLSNDLSKKDKTINDLTNKVQKQKKAIRILLIPWILIVLYVVYRIVKPKL